MKKEPVNSDFNAERGGNPEMNRRVSLWRWLPVGLWYAVVWGLSSQPAAQSGALSGGILYRVLEQFSVTFRMQDAAGRNAIVAFLSFYERKAAHMFLYFVLAGLLWYALGRLVASNRWRAVAALGFCGILAAADEFHQTFVPGRSGQWSDVLVDLAGGLCFLALWFLAGCIWRGWPRSTDRTK